MVENEYEMGREIEREEKKNVIRLLRIAVSCARHHTAAKLRVYGECD